MARIRSIKPEFWTSEQVTECSLAARLLFIGIWNFADDYGVHPASPRRLKMEVFPSDSLTAADIETLINELVAAELLIRFEAEGAEYLLVTGWRRHQKVDKPNRKYPAPPRTEQPSPDRGEFDEQSPSARGTVVELSSSVRRAVAERSPPDVEVEVEKEGSLPSGRANSDPNGSAAPDDPEREMWNRGKSLLVSGGVPADKAGPIIGRWRKEYRSEAVIAAIIAAEKECVSDPVAFVMACLVASSKKRSRAPPRSADGYVPMHPGAGG